MAPGSAKDTSGQTPLPPVVRKSLESGLISRGSISENNRPMTSVEEAVNMDFDTIGAAKTRLGTVLLGLTLNSNTSSDTGMVYGTAYGKFNQGAGFLTNSAINFGSYTLPTVFSYSVWFKTSTGSNVDMVLLNFSGNYILSVNHSTGVVKFTSNSNVASSPSGFNDGNWHHAVVTFNANGGIGVLYVDGVQEVSFSGFFTTTGSSDFIAGSTSTGGGSQQFVGDMDDVALFNRQLTYFDVQNLFANELANTYLISDNTLFIYAQMEGNSNNYQAPILGMHYYVDTFNNGLNTQMIVVVGTSVFIAINLSPVDGWTAVRTSLKASSKARFATLLNNVFMVNGTDPTAVWNGVLGTAFTTPLSAAPGNVINAPTGQFVETFRGRVWIGGNTTNPDFLYYSNPLNALGVGTITTTNTGGSNNVTGTNTKFTNLAIGDTITIGTETQTISAINSDTQLTTGAWAEVNTNVGYTTTPIINWELNGALQYIPISFGDGEYMTGLQRWRNEMIVFKTNHMYRVFDIGQTDPGPWYPVGTSSQESVVETKSGIFFHHSSGFYMYDIYDMVQEISRPIIDYIKAIPSSTYTAISGWLEPDGDHVCWSVGNVTVRGIVYKNLVLRYSISTQVWQQRTYPTQIVNSLRRQPLFNDGNNQYAMTGDTAGNVLKMNTGYTDNVWNGTTQVTTNIPYTVVHAWDNIDGLLSTRKIVATVNFTHYQGTNGQVAFQTEDQDPDDLTNWTGKVGTLTVKNTGFNTLTIKGRKIRFRIAGESNGQQFFYYGYEIIGALNEFYQFPNN